MIEEVEQRDHFFSEGDRIVLKGNGYKRMSYRDILIQATIYRVVAVVNKDMFKVRLVTR